MIVCTLMSDGPLFRIAATGGNPQPLTSLDSTKHESGHRFPEFLPDGRHVLLSVLPSKDERYDIDCVRLDATGCERVASLPSGVHCTAPGWLLCQRKNLKMSKVLSAIVGQSGRAVLAAIVAGETNPAVLAQRINARVKAPRPTLIEALRGRITKRHRFMHKLHFSRGARGHPEALGGTHGDMKRDHSSRSSAA